MRKIYFQTRILITNGKPTSAGISLTFLKALRQLHQLLWPLSTKTIHFVNLQAVSATPPFSCRVIHEPLTSSISLANAHAYKI